MQDHVDVLHKFAPHIWGEDVTWAIDQSFSSVHHRTRNLTQTPTGCFDSLAAFLNRTQSESRTCNRKVVTIVFFSSEILNARDKEIQEGKVEWKNFFCNGVFAQCYLLILTNLSHLDRLYWRTYKRTRKKKTTSPLKPISKQTSALLWVSICWSRALFKEFHWELEGIFDVITKL